MEKSITLLLFLLFSSTLSFAQQRPQVEFSVDVIEANPGDTICIPVRVKNFNNILGIGFGMKWLPTRLSFLELKTDLALPDISAADFGLTDVDEGNLKWSWITSSFPDGASLADDAVIFEVCFVQNSNLAEGRFTYLSFDSDFVNPEVILDDRVETFPLAYGNFIPGGVFVNAPNSDLKMLPTFDFALECGALSANIIANVSGGQEPYTYSWTGPDVPDAGVSDLNGITTPGIYVLEVSDQTGNAIVGSVEVDFMNNEDGLANPEFSATLTEPTCGTQEGAIQLNIRGDEEDVSILWSNGETGSSITQLGVGDYGVTITSIESGCTTTELYNLTAIGSFNLDTLNARLNCEGDTARIGFTGLDDNANINILWGDASSDATLLVDAPGTYIATVTDGSCEEVYSFEVISVEDAPNIDDFEVISENIRCETGFATIGLNYTGTRDDLSYTWSTEENTSQILVFEDGTYTVEVAGANGCSTAFSIEVIEEPADFDLTPINEFLGCLEGSSRIGLQVNDDRAYQFNWNTGETSATFNVSEAGVYTVTVTEEGTFCTDVFTLDLSDQDLKNGAINIDYECFIENDCLSGANLNISLGGYDGTVTYNLSDGTSIVGGAVASIPLTGRQPLELYISNEDGCRDTVQNIIANCAFAGSVQELNVRQYVVCEENPETQALEATLYNEVLGNLATPPYAFFWSNGFEDTSYYRSSQPLDSLPNLFISVTDFLGNRFSRQLSEPVSAYGCGTENTPVFSAEQVIVSPGEAFTYPMYLNNHQGLERAIYTIDWDPCLLSADSIAFYFANGDTVINRNIFPGTYETFFLEEGGSQTNDSIIVAEIFFQANNLEGVSPFLYSINEVAKNGDGSEALVRPQHGSITIASSNALIFPGDADQNGQVNQYDLLNLGLGYQVAGPDRREAQIDRQAFAYPWLQSTPLSGVDYKNLDCNGDGHINQQDLMAIDQNFQNPAPEAGRVQSSDGDIPLFFDVDTVVTGQEQVFPILLGEEMLPAEGVYGIAFSLDFDASIIDPNSISVDFSNSWLTVGSTPLIISKVDAVNQRINIAISRTDQNNQSGFGAIASVTFTSFDTEATNTNFQITDVKMINVEEMEVLTMNPATSAVVDRVSSIRNAPELANKIQLYPVPVRNQLYIDVDGLSIERLEIYDTNGKLLSRDKYTRPVLDFSNYQNGIYWMRFITKEGVISKKLIK